MERRNGITRGIYNRLIEDDRSSIGRILSEVQWCLNSAISAGSFAAYQMVFGPSPAELFRWEGGDGDLMFTQDTFSAGQFVQQWKLRVRGQEAALKEVAGSKLRRLVAHNKDAESQKLAPLAWAREDLGRR